MGSSTLNSWIEFHLTEDANNGIVHTYVSPPSAVSVGATGAIGGQPPARPMPMMNRSPPAAFPQAVGMNGDDALKQLAAENPKLRFFVVPEGSMVTMDYRLDRVRIFVDVANIVVKCPVAG